jgi:hypothetical protein
MEMIDIITRLRQQQQGMLRKGEFAFINRSDIVELLTMVDALRVDLEVMTQEHRAACQDRDLMIRERDEARQFVCNREYLMTGMTTTPQEIAKERGWDCFPQEDKPCQ